MDLFRSPFRSGRRFGYYSSRRLAIARDFTLGWKRISAATDGNAEAQRETERECYVNGSENARIINTFAARSMAGGSQRQIRRIQLDALDLWILHHYVGFILFRIPHTFRSQNAIPATTIIIAANRRWRQWRSAYYDCLLVCLQACCSLLRRAHRYTFAVIPEPLSVGAESAADLPGRAPGGAKYECFHYEIRSGSFHWNCYCVFVWCSLVRNPFSQRNGCAPSASGFSVLNFNRPFSIPTDTQTLAFARKLKDHGPASYTRTLSN